jgi:ferredoxin-NADP reductase
LTIAVSLDENSRGGSQYLHSETRVREVIEVAKGVEDVPGSQDAGEAAHIERRIFIVGGIGITAFLQEMRDLEAKGKA